MLNIEGIKSIKKIKWNEIQPGMILLGGLRINNQVPDEFKGFPVLNPLLLEDLANKFRLQYNREVIIAECASGFSPLLLSRQLRKIDGTLKKVNFFRNAFFSEKQRLTGPEKMEPNLPLMESGFVSKRDSIENQGNSFTLPELLHANKRLIPTFLSDAPKPITLGQILAGQKEGPKLPDDKHVLLHVVICYSFSINLHEKLNTLLTALSHFTRSINEFLGNTSIKYYVFSNECRPVNFPLNGKEMKKEDAAYSTFIKKVLHHKNRDIRNKVILFTDTPPVDREEAIHFARLFKKNKIDYTQILLNPEEHLYPVFTDFAHSCGGNQIILKDNKIAGLAALECYDRYLGLLTLAAQKAAPVKSPQEGISQPPPPKQQTQDQSLPDLTKPTTVIFPGAKKKIVKKWTPGKVLKKNK